MSRALSLFFLILIPLFLFSTTPDDITYCQFITAKNGLNVRTTPSLKGEIITKLPYGAIVQVNTSEEDFTVAAVVDNGRKVEGKWVSIIFSNGLEKGYVFDAYLSDHLTDIPDSALYFYYQFSETNFNISYNEMPIDYINYSDGDYACNCYSYYEKNKTIPTISKGIQHHYDSTNITDPRLEDLKKYLALEIVALQDYQHKKVNNPFQIDTTSQIINNSTNPDANDFYLLLDNQQDSIHIYDQESEVYMTRKYIGEIKALNKYLVENFYEYPVVYAIDKTTGKEEVFSESTPHLSPDGKYIISFYETFSYNYDIACAVTIKQRNDPTKVVFIDFKSWLPAAEFQAFWVSNTEIILKVFPVDNRTNRFPSQLEIPNYQYLKLTIK